MMAYMATPKTIDKDKENESIPGGVAADDGIGVVLVHCRSTGNAEDEREDHDDHDVGHDGCMSALTMTPILMTLNGSCFGFL